MHTAPGVIKTNFSRALWEDEQLLKENNDCFMKRAGTPDEIAGAAAFLCSDDASFITGWLAHSFQILND